MAENVLKNSGLSFSSLKTSDIFPSRPGLYQYLQNIYTQPSSKGGSLGGIRNLYLRVKADGIYKKVTVSDIRRFLATQPSYTVHKPTRIHHPTAHIFSAGPGYLVQGDLADLSILAPYNKNVHFLVCTVDTFTKFTNCVPVQRKDATSVCNALKKIFPDYNSSCLYFEADEGREWTNFQVQQFLQKYDTKLITSKGNWHCSYIERKILDIKSKIWNYLTANDTKSYLPALDQIIDSLNSTPSRQTGYAPKNIDFTNIHEVFQKLYHKTFPISGLGGKLPAPKNYKNIHVGSYVRISTFKTVFDKRHKFNYSREIFIVKRLVHSHPLQVVLMSMDYQDIIGKFYINETEPVIITDQTFFQIEKIIKTAKLHNSVYYYVKWRDYPETCNSWIPKNELLKKK